MDLGLVIGRASLMFRGISKAPVKRCWAWLVLVMGSRGGMGVNWAGRTSASREEMGVGVVVVAAVAVTVGVAVAVGVVVS